MDDKRTLLWYQKTLGKNKTSAVYKPKTIFNKNNCLIICDIYRKSLSLSIENKEINKLLKLDPGNTELLAQKHKLLGQAVSETKDKLATLKTAAEQANTALAKGEIS